MGPGTWMTSCPEARMISEIWKKAVSWDSDLGEARRLCALRAPRVGRVSWQLRFGLGRRKSIFGARQGLTNSLQRGPHVVGFRWKSQHRKKLCLSLSSCRKILNSKKKFHKKVSYLNQKRVVKCFECFRIPICIMNILCLFNTFISWSISWTHYILQMETFFFSFNLFTSSGIITIFPFYCGYTGKNIFINHIYQPLRSSRIWQKVNFLSGV